MPQDIPYNALSPPDIYAEEVAGLQNQLHVAQDPAVAGREALARIMMTLAMPLSSRGVTPPRGPWTPSAQAPRIRREAKQDGDDGAGQHVYEALLGRSRKPGQAVGEPGSGWWMVGGQPIPKPTNVLPWLASLAGGYGVYNLLGGPSWEDITAVTRRYQPGTPEYEDQQKHAAGVRERSAGERASSEAWRANHALEKQLGLVTSVSGPSSIFGPHPEPDDAKRARAVHEYLTAGGTGNAPY